MCALLLEHPSVDSTSLFFFALTLDHLMVHPEVQGFTSRQSLPHLGGRACARQLASSALALLEVWTDRNARR